MTCFSLSTKFNPTAIRTEHRGRRRLSYPASSPPVSGVRRAQICQVPRENKRFQDPDLVRCSAANLLDVERYPRMQVHAVVMRKEGLLSIYPLLVCTGDVVHVLLQTHGSRLGEDSVVRSYKRNESFWNAMGRLKP